MEIYYENQNGWGKNEYYYLHRVLHRLLSYHQKYIEEIKHLEPSKMAPETKVLIKCIIKYYNKDFLFATIPDGDSIKNIGPLKNTLILDDNPLPEENIYKSMNVQY